MSTRLQPRPSVFAELRRRHVVRVALAYGVVGWLVFEVSSEAFPALGLPDWSVTLVLALLLVGFPLALALAWAFDVTPAGIRRTSSADADEEAGEPTGHPPTSARGVGSASRLPGTAAAGSVDAGAADVSPSAPGTSSAPARAATTRTGIAVLPFVNMSGDPENEYFSDGVTEDLLTQLSRIEGLRVVSRTTVMRYKGSDLSIAEIARELDVPTVLEGSVRRAGSRVRITAQLINARGDEHLWAESFDREIEDIFEVQSEVALSIARALRTELSDRDEARLRRKPTTNMEAYNLVLRARAHGNTFTASGFETAIRLYRRATELDPGYARAYVGIADTYSVMALMQFRPRTEVYEPGLAAARRAVELDPDLPEAYGALGGLQMLCDWDWPGADRSFRRALELDPDHPDTLSWHALYLLVRERGDEALAAARRAKAVAPHDLATTHVLAQVLIFTERLDEAVALMDSTLELEPGFAVGRYWRAYAFAASGRAEEAASEFRALLEQGVLPPLWEAVRGAMLAALGHEAEARAVLEDLEARRASGEEVGRYALFSLHLGLGEYDQALDHLEAAVETREPTVLYIRAAPRFRPLRAHPRFRRMLATIWPQDFGQGETSGG